MCYPYFVSLFLRAEYHCLRLWLILKCSGFSSLLTRCCEVHHSAINDIKHWKFPCCKVGLCVFLYWPRGWSLGCSAFPLISEVISFQLFCFLGVGVCSVATLSPANWSRREVVMFRGKCSSFYHLTLELLGRMGVFLFFKIMTLAWHFDSKRVGGWMLGRVTEHCPAFSPPLLDVDTHIGRTSRTLGTHKLNNVAWGGPDWPHVKDPSAFFSPR